MAIDKKTLLYKTYEVGKTTVFSSRMDSRFCYCLYVPHRFDENSRAQTTLLISVHGTGRMQALYRDLFCEFSEYNNCIVLAPLFPANVCQDGNMSGYKYLKEGDIRYDLVLLDMAAEVAQRYRIAVDKVLLFGFSGGAHFAHRFLLLHPHRIKAVSIGAPGVVTLPLQDKPWWVGIGGAHQVFGLDIDPAALAGVAVHLVVGGADTETWEITVDADDAYYMEGINDSGRTRGERLQSLADGLSSWGARVRKDVVPGETHDVVPISQKTREFFYDVLNDLY